MKASVQLHVRNVISGSKKLYSFHLFHQTCFLCDVCVHRQTCPTEKAEKADKGEEAAGDWSVMDMLQCELD